MKKLNIRFSAQMPVDGGAELLRHDVEQIKAITPTFVSPPIISRPEVLHNRAPAGIEAKTFLSMPIKKGKKE